MNNRVKVYKDIEWHWVVYNNDNEEIASSVEGYKRSIDAVRIANELYPDAAIEVQK